MVTIISEGTQTAKKRYWCDAYDVITHQCQDLIPSCKGRIEIGQKYHRQFNTDGSDKWTFRACLECDKIYMENKLWEDD